MELSGLHQRLHTVIGETSLRKLGSMTGHSPETIRRYLYGQAPSVEFVSALCGALELNAHWVLTGKGPPFAGDIKQQALKQANPAELLAMIAEALEKLTDRIDRLEVFVQTQEARLRTRSRATAEVEMKGASASSGQEVPHGEEAQQVDHIAGGDEAPGAASAAGAARDRARRIAKAIPKRSPPDAD